MTQAVIVVYYEPAIILDQATIPPPFVQDKKKYVDDDQPIQKGGKLRTAASGDCVQKGPIKTPTPSQEVIEVPHRTGHNTSLTQRRGGRVV